MITYAIAGKNIEIRWVNILTKHCDRLGFVYFIKTSKTERSSKSWSIYACIKQDFVNLKTEVINLTVDKIKIVLAELSKLSNAVNVWC